MNQEVINKIVAKITAIFASTAKQERVKEQTSFNNNVFGARVKSYRGETDVNVVFDDHEALIHVSGGLFTFKDDLVIHCRTMEDFNNNLIKIESFVKDCFTLKLVKK